ncbi:LysR family transcriptional regulator [Salipiger bermudensis]|uniref:Transcriptional regulator, LysR family protein n=1 Tax=Salipiger bermudensis (strain DSM 26914 / JCM 13377 / KCTC 12554 / HTCC2601) TaxID=314265 RepID=Q0FSX6_SALBH|nr:LysR family transcriptional regulator [Salipiger bermudensis]EAU47393.1 transcriptional regulator, LysR family protein [Salipiger bermudensis HTCC2601]MBN9678322.1 LysR family transcriptional regulator [Salipiger bermudensis]
MDSTELKIFIATAEEGSFAGAGRKLQISPASVTRAIAALEARLEVRLFTRTTRQCRLTLDGERFLERCAPLVSELEDAEDEIRTGRLGPNGALRVAAPLSFGRRQIAPLVTAFRRKYPQISVQLTLSDESDDLLWREYDCALRVGRPTKGEFITRRLLKARRVVCAAPLYLENRAAPQVPDDLAEHRGIVLIRDGQLLDQWMFEIDGVMRSVSVPATLASNSGEVTQSWALHGEGVVLKSIWDVQEDLAEGRLMELLPDYSVDNADIFLVYPARRYVPSRTRSFIDFLAEAFAGPAGRIG